MKTLRVTNNFDEAATFLARLDMTKEMVEQLELNPNQCISFAFYKLGDKWEVIGASLIPNTNIPQQPIEELYKERVGE